ncbi:uncharacterized protein WCC33_002715 [Rhinophrynus dorsalis]
MNNCDLEKFSVPGVVLEPTFRADITNYKATVPSHLKHISIDACPSDTGASYTLLGNGGSKVITLEDGLNTVTVEVTAEDGTVKKYAVEVIKLSASHASIQEIKISEDLKLVPSFAPDVFEYSCSFREILGSAIPRMCSNPGPTWVHSEHLKVLSSAIPGAGVQWHKVFLLEDKILQIMKDVPQDLEWLSASVREYMKVLGHLVSTLEMVPYSLVHTRELHRLVIQSWHWNTGLLNQQLSLSLEARQDLEWWLQQPHLDLGKPFVIQERTMVMMDASLRAWGTVPYFQNIISIQPCVQDSKMNVMVNGSHDIKPITLALGDTHIELQVSSADGTKSQIYCIIVTRTQLPCCVSFTDIQDQMNYECPVSLTAFYRPISVKGSNPKHTISGPYMDLLTRMSKTDPLDESFLNENWRLPEYELDMNMSAANVYCIYAYRGCGSIVKLSELGHHARSCSFKPSNELDAKAVMETDWYKTEFSSSKKMESNFKHQIQVRSWEKRLQQEHEDSQVDKLCTHAEEQIRFYVQCLPKPGDVLQYSEQMSPLNALHQAAIAYASAIKLKPKDPKFHFQLGMVLEEHYYAAEIYGLRKKTEDDSPDFSSAKATGKDEEILAISKLHGFSGRPSLEQQLKALDLEYHQLKEQGQPIRADYILNLYSWKSQQAGKTAAFSVDDENPLTQAFLKYQDALSLNPDHWQYNFHVGRHMLLKGKYREALMFLQHSLALQPSSAVTRCYTGLALIEQDDGPGKRTQESIHFLHQGLEKMLTDSFTTLESSSLLHADNPLSLLNAQILRGFSKLGKLLKNISAQQSSCIMTSQQVLHIIADWCAKGICQCPQRGEVTQELQRVQLDSCIGLLEFLVQEAPDKEEWIRKRCQGMSALIRLSSIPQCKELLDMQEKVCQLGVISSPCNSYSLYLLGVAQLAQYDNQPSAREAQLAIQDSKLSFEASINLESKPTKGPPTAELTNQKWWQEWKAVEELKRQKQLNKACDTEKHPASTSMSMRGTSKGRGAIPAARSANTTSRPSSIPKKTATVAPFKMNCKAGSRGITRGRGTTGLPSSKTAASGSSKLKATGSPSSTANATEPQLSTEKPTMPESKHVHIQESASGPVSINGVSFLHRLGLARVLSRSKETAADASALYKEVINMAPEVQDAYIELADLLLQTDPTGAIDVYCQYRQKPIQEQSFDDAFISGEIVRLLLKYEKYDDPRLPANMISYGKVMGLGCLEKYITILEDKFKTSILKTVYAGIHDKPVDDTDLQNFFRFKCWI